MKRKQMRQKGHEANESAVRGATRRRFLGAASLGLGAAAGLPALAAVARSAYAGQAADRKLGYALVGLGRLSTGQLGPALRETKRCELRGIVTGTPAKAERWKQEYGIPEGNIYNYETYDRIADNEDIDVIYIVLPNSMHAEYTIRAAKAGKHVLCEKPMATSVADCQAMIDACNKAQRRLAIGYRLHFEPHNLEMARLGQQEQFGPVMLVEGSFAFTIGDPNQWRLDRELAGGGPMMDVGIYAVNGACYVTGQTPVSVTAQAFRTDPEKFDEVEETLLWQMAFPGGAAFNGSTSYNASVNRLYFSGRRGWAELSPAYSYGGLRGRSSSGPIEMDQINQFAAEMDDFAERILSGEPTPVPGEMGLRDVKIMMAAYRAAETGRKIEIA